MNKEIIYGLPKQGDTLEYNYVNNPFWVYRWSVFETIKGIQGNVDDAKKLKTYYNGKNISVTSDGIGGVFKFDYLSNSLHVESPLRLSSEDVSKGSVDGVKYPASGPLNMEELQLYLGDNGLLSYSYVFSEIQKKSDYPLSNLMTMQSLIDTTYERLDSTLALVSPLAVSNNITANSILNFKTMNEKFLSKYVPFDTLNIKNDNIDTALFEKTSLIDPVMESGNTGNVRNLSELSQLLYGVNGGRVSIDEAKGAVISPFTPLPSLFILSPISQESPANKKYVDEVCLDYVDLVTPVFGDTQVTQFGGFSGDSIMSIGDAKRHIESYFDRLTSNSVGSVSEFKKYIDGVCTADYSGFLDYSFSVSGGKIYNGFDYDNKHSILNSKALKSILIDKTGKYTRDMPIVYSAALYFTDVSKVNELSAYAQKVGYPFDIATDTIAQVFMQLRGVVGKLCSMTPDVVPEDEDPVIPVFKASAFFAPPSIYATYSPWIGRSSLQKPLYYPDVKIYVSAPPHVGQYVSIVTSPYLNKPMYLAKLKDKGSYSAPSIGSFTPSQSHDTIEYPSESQMRGDITMFEKEDPYEPYITLFSSSDGCDNRFGMYSYRQVNMMEVSVVASALIESSLKSNFYFHSKSTDYVLLKSQFLLVILGDVFCRMSEKIRMRMTVDMSTLVVIAEPDDEDQSENSSISSCLSNISKRTSISTLNESSDMVNVHVNGRILDSAGNVSGSNKLDKTEILGTIDLSGIEFDWSTRYGSDSYNSKIEEICDIVIPLVSEYENGKIYTDTTSIEDDNVTISSVSLMEKGYVLAEYLEGISAELGGVRKTTTRERYGVYEDDKTVEPIPLIEYTVPYSNVLVGNDGATPSADRRKDIENPKPGINEIKVWKPLYAAYNSNVASLEYLGLSDDTKAVFTLYGPMVLIYKEDNKLYYDPIGVETTASVESISGENHHVLKALDSRVILYKTSSGGAPTKKKFTRDYCDDWKSPFSSFGQISLGLGTLSPLISQGGGTREGIISNVSTSIESHGGCDSVVEFEGTSGISMTNVNNISDLVSLDPNSPEQEEGDVPGAYTFNLKMKATKYAPFVSSGNIVNRVESTNFEICVTLGVIDGVTDSGGDVLAQGYTQDEIPSSGGDPVVYIAPHPLLGDYMEFERITIGEFSASKYTIKVSDLVFDKLLNDSNGEKFIKYLDVTDGQWKEASVKISSVTDKQEEATPFRTVLLGDIRSPGGVFTYKHAGQDPAYPIITGYAGSTEVDFVNGTRLVGTTFTPIPLATYTNDDDASEFIPSVDLTVNTVHFFINNSTIEIVLRDTKAVFSENRTIKIVME